MTLGEVHVSPTPHRGPLSKRLENGPFGTLDRNPKSKIVRIGEECRQIGVKSKRL